MHAKGREGCQVTAGKPAAFSRGHPNRWAFDLMDVKFEPPLQASSTNASNQECLRGNPSSILPEHSSQEGYNTFTGQSQGLFAQQSQSTEVHDQPADDSTRELNEPPKKTVIHQSKRQKAALEDIADMSVPKDAIIKSSAVTQNDYKVLRVVEPFYQNTETAGQFCEFSGYCRDSAVEDFAHNDYCDSEVCPEFCENPPVESVDFKLQTGCQPYCDQDYQGSGKHYKAFSHTPIHIPIQTPTKSSTSLPLFAAEVKFDHLRIVPPNAEEAGNESGKTTIQINTSLTAASKAILKSLLPLLTSLGCSPDDLQQGTCQMDLNSLISRVSAVLSSKCFDCNLCTNQDESSGVPVLHRKPSGISVQLRESTTDNPEDGSAQRPDLTTPTVTTQ